MKPITRLFLLDWLQWSVGLVRSNGRQPFHPAEGLCISIERYCHTQQQMYQIHDDLKELWEAQGRNLGYPFGSEVYHQARFNSTMHLCPHRRLWVLQTLGYVPKKRWGRYVSKPYKFSCFFWNGKPIFARTYS